MYFILKGEKPYPNEPLFISWFVGHVSVLCSTTLATKILNVKSILGVI